MVRAHRSPATLLLLALAALSAAVPLSMAVRAALTSAGVLEVDPDAVASAGALGVFSESAYRDLEVVTAVIGGLAAVVAVVLLVGLLLWRSWAREAVLGVYGLVGALLCVLALGGQGPGSGAGLAAGLVLLLTAGLAVTPPVCTDFDRVRIAAEVRERRRLEARRRG